MPSFHEIELTDAQMAAMCEDVHIVASDPGVTETTVRNAWVMFNGRRYVATVYSQKIALDMLGDDRATEMRISRSFRHPQSETEN